MGKKIWFLSAALTLLLSVCTTQALAADGTINISGTSAGYRYEGEVLTILSGDELTLSGTSSHRIVIGAGVHANVSFNGLTIDQVADYQPAVTMEDGATLNLTIGDSDSTVTGGKGRAALEVPAGTHLIITEQSTGTLTAVGGARDNLSHPAAIGGSAKIADGTAASAYYSGDVGSITINGGNIVAHVATAGGATVHGAGIGAARRSTTNYADYTSCGIIAINGGTVSAAGAPAIGGLVKPDYDDAPAQGSVTITGGTVTATTLISLRQSNAGEVGSTAGGIVVAGGTVNISGGTVDILGDPTVSGQSEKTVALGGQDCTVSIQHPANVTARVKEQASDTAVGGPGSQVSISGGSLTVQSDAYLGMGADTLSGDRRASLTISGGEVTVSRFTSTAIGSSVTGIGGSACDVLISGGTVSSYGYQGGAAIGSTTQVDTYCGTVTITGGTITTTSVKRSDKCGAGIGAADGTTFADDAHVTILGGTVIATAAEGYGISTDGHFHAGNEGTGGALIYATIDSADKTDTTQWNAVVFESTAEKNSTVYGNPTLSCSGTLYAYYNLIIPEGHVLTISDGVTLTVENEASITNSGTVDLYGSVIGTITDNGGTVNHATVTKLTVSNTAPTIGDEELDTVTFTATISRRTVAAVPFVPGGKVAFYRGNDLIGKVDASLLENETTMKAELTVRLDDKDGWGITPTCDVYAVYEGARGADTYHLDSQSATVSMEISLLASVSEEDVTAAFSEDRVTLSVDVTRPSEDVTVLAAAYDKDGRMLGVFMVHCARNQGTTELIIDCDGVPVKASVFMTQSDSLSPIMAQISKQTSAQ